jgi:hypothetical protein
MKQLHVAEDVRADKRSRHLLSESRIINSNNIQIFIIS